MGVSLDIFLVNVIITLLPLFPLDIFPYFRVLYGVIFFLQDVKYILSPFALLVLFACFRLRFTFFYGSSFLWFCWSSSFSLRHFSPFLLFLVLLVLHLTFPRHLFLSFFIIVLLVSHVGVGTIGLFILHPFEKLLLM